MFLGIVHVNLWEKRFQQIWVLRNDAQNAAQIFVEFKDLDGTIIFQVGVKVVKKKWAANRLPFEII